MGEKHYEIIVSQGQMALGVIALVGAVLVAFGLGVAVGLLEPRGEGGARQQGQVVTVVAEPPLVTFAPPLPRPGEGGGPPVSPAPPAVGPAEPAPPPPPASPPPPPSPSPDAPPPGEPPATPSPAPSPVVPPTPPALPPAAAAAAGVWVQVGALSQARQGDGLRQRVVALGFAPEQVVISRGPDGRYRVRLGPFPDEESAGRVVARLRPQGFPDAFMVRE